MPSWFSKSLVMLLSAVLVYTLVEGGSWFAAHPLPEGTMMPMAMVAGLAGLVYGARKGR